MTPSASQRRARICRGRARFRGRDTERETFKNTGEIMERVLEVPHNELNPATSPASAESKASRLLKLTASADETALPIAGSSACH